MKFSEIKHKIKNLGNFRSLKEIKKAGLRIVRNTATGDYWLIEEEFLKPVIKSPRELKTILVKPDDLKFKVLMVDKSKKELKGKKVLDYIEWGEKQGFHKRPTCKSRKWWWCLDCQKLPMIIAFMFEDERKFSCFNNCAYVDAAIYTIYPSDVKILCFLNSTLFALFKEILARPPEGLGALQLKIYDFEKLPCILLNYDINILNYFSQSIFTELGFDPDKPIREQEPNPLPDRKALDDIVFDALGLTEEERKEVYWAVAELVQNRLKKATSV